MLRYHLDENVTVAIAKGLRAHGIDVTTPVDVDLISAADDEHIRFCIAAQRVIVTHDDDFLSLASRSQTHHGVAYCPPGMRTIGHIIRRLLQLSDECESSDMIDKVEFL